MLEKSNLLVAKEGAVAGNGAIDDKRRSMRKNSVLRIGRLSGEFCDHLCLVQDISSNGAQIKLNASINVEQSVILALGDRTGVRGTVRWINAPNAGIEFEAPIAIEANPVEPSTVSLSSPRSRRRYPRFARCATVLIQHSGIGILGDLVNFSQGGVGVTLDQAMIAEVGAFVNLTVRGFGQHVARVCWKRGMNAGLAFDVALPFHAAEKWVDNSARKCRFCTKMTCEAPSFELSITRRHPRPAN